MSQSLYTAMGGIAAATTGLSVISNNVANINTPGYKGSSVQFSDVYSTTLSYGSVSTSTSGGTNPKQIGVGTQVGAISKNFNTGSWNATGKSTDLMINGQGFFSVQATDGTTYYTRAGNFNIDENGNLVTPSGFKVLGTDSNLATHSSSTTVKIPTAITANVSGTDLSTVGNTKKVMDLNSTKSHITDGKFQVSVNGSTPVSITVDADGTVDNMINKINAQLAGAAAPVNGVSLIKNTDGTISFKTANPADTLALSTPTANASNFLTQTGLGTAKEGSIPTITSTAAAATAALTEGAKTLIVGDSTTGASTTLNLTGAYANVNAMVSDINTQLAAAGSTITATNVGGTVQFSQPAGDTVTLGGTSGLYTGATTGTQATGKYTSIVLDQSVHITDLTSKSTSANSETINADGSIQVTYKDGSTLSVEPQKDGTYSFVYTTSDSIKINGSDCAVDTSVATPANFVIQMATVTNTEGLLSEGNNLYAAGPNTGDIVYTVAGDMGCGKIASGGLESSNVDLAGELSNMILAQRAIQANSRVFTTTSNIMDTINQMGR